MTGSVRVHDQECLDLCAMLFHGGVALAEFDCKEIGEENVTKVKKEKDVKKKSPKKVVKKKMNSKKDVTKEKNSKKEIKKEKGIGQEFEKEDKKRSFEGRKFVQGLW